MTTTTDLPSLPSRSTGWKKGTVRLRFADTRPEVPGLVKGAYGVSRGPNGEEIFRLTHLASGSFLTMGDQAVCKRLGDALTEHVPSLGAMGADADSTLLPEGERKALLHLVRQTYV